MAVVTSSAAVQTSRNSKTTQMAMTTEFFSPVHCRLNSGSKNIRKKLAAILEASARGVATERGR